VSRGERGPRGDRGEKGQRGAEGVHGEKGDDANPFVPVLVILVLGLQVLLVGGLTAFSLDLRETQATAEADRLTQCRKDNIRAAYHLSGDAPSPAIAERIFYVADCKREVDTGVVAPVSRAVRDEYVRMVVEDRRLPIIEDGQIVTAIPIPKNR
jgi:hypothetical protein